MESIIILMRKIFMRITMMILRAMKMPKTTTMNMQIRKGGAIGFFAGRQDRRAGGMALVKEAKTIEG